MVKNFGVSFGQQIPSLLLLTTLIWFLTLGWLIKSKNWRVGLIVLGGGLNLWQRWQLGYVIDYWKIPMTNIYNNINDWLIFAGVILYIWQQIRQK